MYNNTFTLKRFFICAVIWFGLIGGLWAYGWRTNFNANQVETKNGEFKVQTPFGMKQSDVDVVSPFYDTKKADSIHAKHENELKEHENTGKAPAAATPVDTTVK